MARFYGSMKGSRGEATRAGTASSGFEAHIRGWHAGVRIDCHAENGIDVIEVWETGGSTSPSSKKLLAKLEK